LRKAAAKTGAIFSKCFGFSISLSSPQLWKEQPPDAGDEIHGLRRLQREQGASSHVFMTERDGPMSPRHSIGRIGERAKMPFPVHPHILRHGCGYAGANV
jgi:hypothetical protein